MIIFSNNCKTSDGIEIQLFVASSHDGDVLILEIIIQYLDEQKIIYSKDITSHKTSTQEELLCIYDSKINKAVKTINCRTLQRLFNFND